MAAGHSARREERELLLCPTRRRMMRWSNGNTRVGTSDGGVVRRKKKGEDTIGGWRPDELEQTSGWGEERKWWS